jgi:hypothetical protein
MGKVHPSKERSKVIITKANFNREISGVGKGEKSA